MSLQVWLPLNGTLVNNGLNPIQPVAFGTALGTADGKTGPTAYNWTVDGQGVSLNGFMNTFKTYTKYSLSAWVYYTGPATNHSSAICSSGDWNSTAGQLCFGLYSYSGGYKHLLVPNRSGWSSGISLSSALAINTWHHITVTYDGSITRGYINGEYIGSYNGGGITPSSNTSNLYIGGATYYTGFTLRGKINDFRIYDNCLSQKEIKELSKGLIVHLPLDNGGFGGINLLKGGYRATTTKDGNTAKGSLSFDTSLMSLNDLIGKTITFSFDYSCTGTKLNATGDYTKDRYGFHLTMSYVNSSGTAATTYPCTSYLEFTGTGRAIQTFAVPSSWKSITGLSVAIQPNNKPAADSNHVWYLKNVKLEIGSTATAYSPNPNDIGIDQLRVADCSGYRNHSTMKKVMSVQTDTPRYEMSTIWTDATDYISIPNFFNKNQPVYNLTIAGWYKTNTLNGTAPNLFNFGQNSGVRFRLSGNASVWSYWNVGASSAKVSVSATAPTTNDNKWHHWALTYNKGVIKTYFDGKLVNTTDGSSSGTYINFGSISDWGLGGYTATGEKFLGSQSDFRTYCTTLTDADILELYEGRPGMDNSGNSFFYKMTEATGSPTKVESTGVLGVSDQVYESNAANVAYSTRPYDYASTVISFTPAANKENSTTSGFKIFYGGEHMDGKRMKIELDVEWGGGFTFTSGGSNPGIYFQGAMIMQDKTVKWGSLTGVSNNAPSALNNKQNLTALVTSATSGTYHYSAEFTVKCAAGSGAIGHLVGLRSNWSDGKGWIKLSNIKVIPLEGELTPEQKVKISKTSFASNYLYEI